MAVAMVVTMVAAITIGEDEGVLASRSLNVLKRSEKGLLTEYQRSFSFWKESSGTGALLSEKSPTNPLWLANC